MRQTIASALTRFRQGGDIAPVRRHPPASLTIHRRVIGIGDDDPMTTRLEVWRDPFTFVEASSRMRIRDRPQHVAVNRSHGGSPLCASRARLSNCGAQATTSLRGPAGSSYLWETACWAGFPVLCGCVLCVRRHASVQAPAHLVGGLVKRSP